MDPRIEALKSTTFSGRRLTRKQIADIRETVQLFPNDSRNELCKTICEHLHWVSARGSYKRRLRCSQFFCSGSLLRGNWQGRHRPFAAFQRRRGARVGLSSAAFWRTSLFWRPRASRAESGRGPVSLPGGFGGDAVGNPIRCRGPVWRQPGIAFVACGQRGDGRAPGPSSPPSRGRPGRSSSPCREWCGARTGSHCRGGCRCAPSRSGDWIRAARTGCRAESG